MHLETINQALRFRTSIIEIMREAVTEKELLMRTCQIATSSHGYNMASISFLGEESKSFFEGTKENTKSCLTIPIIINNSNYAELTLYAKEEINFQEEVIKILKEVTRDLAYGISSIQTIKKTESQLKSSLKEKEIMLMEIHHRVKNNMQVVYSLLDLQSKKVSDKKTKSILEESRNRIMTMALIHENLYQSENLASVSFKKYLEEVMESVAETYNRPEVDLIIDMDPVELDIHVGIPCGLIANELVSNSFKYAFPDNKKGEIRIGVKRTSEGMNILSVHDNGIGIDKDFDFENATSLGLLIVNVLVAQIKGTIDLTSDNGTKFSITFPSTNMNKEGIHA